MADHYARFPFAEIKTGTEDYFSTWEAVRKAGYDDNQIWSVVESNGSYSYGPPHHIVNLLGYIATEERHDFQTYYHEEAEPNEEDLSLLMDKALEAFEENPSNETAGNLLQALLDAENKGVIGDEEFRDELVSIVSWLKDPTTTDIKGVTRCPPKSSGFTPIMVCLTKSAWRLWEPLSSPQSKQRPRPTGYLKAPSTAGRRFCATPTNLRCEP